MLVLAAVSRRLWSLEAPAAGVAAPVVKADTLVRIDPETNEVSAVVDVGRRPSATAVGGRSVWVYNDRRSVGHGDRRRDEHRPTHNGAHRPPRRPMPFTGPVLAADTAGAWLVGVDARARSYSHAGVLGARGKREYRLQDEPRAVAVGYGAVWVVVRGARDNQLLRIDPATGEVTKRTRFPGSSPIDGLAAGLGSVWVVASSTAMLYRIDPRSAAVTGRIDLGTRRPT